MSAMVTISDETKREVVREAFRRNLIPYTIYLRFCDLKPLKPFQLAKPVHGREKGEIYSVDSVIETLDKYWKGWNNVGIFIDKKYDGARIAIHKLEDELKAFTEEGKDITRLIPSIISDLKAVDHDFIVIGEFELWIDGKHQNRADASAVVNPNRNMVSPDEKYGRFTIYDIAYLDKDIHNLGFGERWKLTKYIRQTKRVKVSTGTVCKTESCVRKAIDKYAKLPGSEGAFIKRLDAKLSISKKQLDYMKFKNELEIDVRVQRVNKVGTGGKTFNYDCVVGDGVYIGRTYNTQIKAKKGDILTVIAVDISKYIDPDTGEYYFNWWSPRVKMLRTDKSKPDSVSTIDRMIDQTSGQVVEKKFPAKIKRILADTSITFIGTRGGNEKSKNHHEPTSLLVEFNGKRIMFDGTDELVEQYNPDAVVLTSVSGLRYKDLNIVSPRDIRTDTIEIPDDDRFYKVCGLKLKPIRTNHDGFDSTFGYVINLDGGKNIGYFPKVSKRLRLDVLDLRCYIGDGMALMKSFPGHLSLREQIDMCESAGISQIIVTNLGNAAIRSGDIDLLMKFSDSATEIMIADDDSRLISIQSILSNKTEQMVKADQKNPFMIRPDENRVWKGMVHVHRRGRSVHCDLRIQVNKDFLVGWTLDIPRGLSKEPETFAEAKRLVEKEIIPIIKERTENPNKKWLVQKKATEPIAWMSYQGRVKPGSVGATRFKNADFIIIDKFRVEFGQLKPDSAEYFFSGGQLFKGKMTFRLIENREEWKKTGEGLFTWMAWRSKNPPYVISKRAVKLKWMPPDGFSALPERFRKEVPKEYQYWKLKGKLARELRDKYVKEQSKQIKSFVDVNVKAKFIAKHQEFKGRKIIREGPSRIVNYILIESSDGGDKRVFVTEQPFEFESMAGKFKNSLFDSVKEADGEVRPGTKLNRTKATPSKIETYDSGKLVILIDGNDFKKFVFKGKKLKGLYVMKKKDRSWILSKSSLPEPRQ